MKEVRHVYDATVRGGEKSGREGDILNIPAAEFELPRQEIEIYVVGESYSLWLDAGPDTASVRLIREREVDREC